MKPFDLEKAKEGAKLCTRDGRPARLLCSDLKDEQFPLAVAITGSDGEEYVTQHSKGGFYRNNGLQDADDLFLAPTKHEGWVNVYKGYKRPQCGAVFATKEEADIEASLGRVACIHIEWEE